MTGLRMGMGKQARNALFFSINPLHYYVWQKLEGDLQNFAKCYLFEKVNTIKTGNSFHVEAFLTLTVCESVVLEKKNCNSDNYKDVIKSL